MLARVSTSRFPQKLQAGFVCVVLVLAVLAVFAQTARFGFIDYDDNINVYENPVVQEGLNAESVPWAFTHTQVINWIPLTTLSHMLDCQLFGLRAGWHHLVNVLFHAAATVLLFLVLRQMTGSLWGSAFVAAVFAVHPLRAESVAWVSERKDVLSAFFFMLTLWAYVRHARRPSWMGYLAVALLFALGLLAKSMVATLPCVLLLLDFWPLKRLQNWQEFRQRFAEKVPLLALAAGTCIVAALVPQMMPSQPAPILQRFDQAAISYVIYLRQMVWPVGLFIPYPSPDHGPAAWKIAAAIVALGGITACAVALRQKRPYLLVGWLWYLGMLLPVMGFFQLALYAHADRYTYLPSIGLALAGTWAVADLSARWKYRRAATGSLMLAVAGAFAVAGHIQTSYWKNNESLWTHTLAFSPNISIVHINLGNDFKTRGNLNKAIAQYRQALEVESNNVAALNDLGNALSANGADAEALAQFQKAVAIQPGYAPSHGNLGDYLQAHGKLDEAIAQFRQALELDPGSVITLNNLGSALAMKGADDEALTHYLKALELMPSFALTHANLGHLLLGHGKTDDAIAQFRESLSIEPANAGTLNDLGKALAVKGSDDEAIAEYEKAVEIQPNYSDAYFNMGNRFLSQGKLDQAIAQYRKTLEVKPTDTDARNNLGKALLLKGDFDGGLACFKKTTSMSAEPLAQWQSLGHGFLQKGNADLAIVCYQQAIKINSNSVDNLASLGMAFLQKGKTKEAMEAMQMALEIDPNQIPVQNSLAWLLATAPDRSLRDGTRAMTLARQADQLSGGANPAILRTLAAAYAEQGDYQTAADKARRALTLALDQKMDALATILQKDAAFYDASATASSRTPQK